MGTDAVRHSPKGASRGVVERAGAWSRPPRPNCPSLPAERLRARPRRRRLIPCRLTVKLSGRPEVPRARQSAITLSAHEAPTHPSVHGPLQRLLEVRPHRLPLCACGAVAATAADRAPVCSAPSWQTELLRAWRAAPHAATAA